MVSFAVQAQGNSSRLIQLLLPNAGDRAAAVTEFCEDRRSLRFLLTIGEQKWLFVCNLAVIEGRNCLNQIGQYGQLNTNGKIVAVRLEDGRAAEEWSMAGHTWNMAIAGSPVHAMGLNFKW